MTQPRLFRKEISQPELDLLLIHLLRSEKVLQAALTRVRPEHFTAAEKVYAIIWSCTSDFYKQNKKLIQKDFLIAEVRRRLNDDPTFAYPGFIEAVTAVAEMADKFPDIVEGYAFELLQEFVTIRQFGNKLREVASGGVVTPAIWDDLVNRFQNTTIDTAVEVSPFDISSMPKLGVRPRHPTGVSFLDTMLGGGVRMGELYGFLAPSGGGKTTLGNQLAVEVSQRNQLTVVMSYEQPVNGEYLIPVYACATKIPRAKWEQINEHVPIEAVLNPEEIKIFNSTRQMINNNLCFVDMSGLNANGTSFTGFGGVDEIRAKLDNIQQTKGRKIDALIVDWFWPLVIRAYDRMNLSHGKRIDSRVYAQSVVDSLRALCSQFDCWGWLNHQLNPAEAKKKRAMSFEDAAELKSFAWYLHGCFCLDKLTEEDQTGTIHFSKARNQKNSSRVVQLHGNVATFVDNGDDLVLDDKLGKYVSKSHFNAIPRPEATKLVSSTAKEFEGPKHRAASF